MCEANSDGAEKRGDDNTIIVLESWEFSDTDALHGLRGLATVHVLLSNYVSFVSSVDLFGGVSASLFLVLSGFILTILYGNRLYTRSFAEEFYLKRLAKLMPLCYLSLMFSIVIGLSCKSRLEFGLSWIYMTGWIGLESFNYPLWTLSVILFFYACFPFFLNYVQKVRHRQRVILAMYWASVALAVAIYFIYIVILSGVPIPLVDVTDPFFVSRSFPPGRIPLFIMAMLFAMERRRPPASSHIRNAGERSGIADADSVIQFAAAPSEEPADEYQRGDGAVAVHGSHTSKACSSCPCCCKDNTFDFLTFILSRYSHSQISDFIAAGLAVSLLLCIIISQVTSVLTWFCLRFLMEFLSPIVFGVWLFVLSAPPHSSDIEDSYFVRVVLKSKLLRAVSNMSLAIYTLHYPIAQYFFLIPNGIRSLTGASMKHPVWSMFPPLLLTFLCAWAITDVVEKRGKVFLLKNLSRGGLHRSDSLTAVGADAIVSPSSSTSTAATAAALNNSSPAAEKGENGYVKVKASDIDNDNDNDDPTSV